MYIVLSYGQGRLLLFICSLSVRTALDLELFMVVLMVRLVVVVCPFSCLQIC